MMSTKVPFDPSEPQGTQIEISARQGRWEVRPTGPCSSHYGDVLLPSFGVHEKSAQAVVDILRERMRQNAEYREGVSRQLERLS